MTGEQMFEAHQDAKAAFLREERWAMQRWDELSAQERLDWNNMACEQHLRDHPESAMLRSIYRKDADA